MRTFVRPAIVAAESVTCPDVAMNDRRGAGGRGRDRIVRPNVTGAAAGTGGDRRGG